MDDLLGDLVKPSAPLKITVRPAGSPVAKEAPQDDLLGSFVNDAQSSSSPSVPTQRPSVASAASPAPTDETLPQAVNRWIAENPGDTWSERGARLGAGVVRGIGDVADTASQGISSLGESGANALARFGMVSPESAAAVRDWRAGINRTIATDQQGFNDVAGEFDLAGAGRIGGQIAGTGPLLAGGGAAINALARGTPIARMLAAHPMINALVTGAGAGTGAAALTSASSNAPVGEQMLQGGILGGALGPLGRGVSAARRAVFGGGVDAETAQLAHAARNTYGIPVGAGQISANPTVRFLDSVLQRLPFTGYGARVTEQQGAFNRAISNTFGEDADKVTPALIRHAQTRLGRVFDDVANRTGPIRIDHQYVHEVNTILNDAHQVLPQGEFSVIHNQLRMIASKVDRATMTLSPETYQAFTRKGAPLDRAIQSKDPNIRYYAGQVREALDDMMQRSAPPDAVQDLIAARAHYKALKTVQPLAKKATTGDISPANVLAAVNKSYSGAGGDLGELGRIGQRFLKEPPSSGTAERTMILQHLVPAAAGLAGAGSLGAATYFDPESYQRNAMLGIGSILAARGTGAVLNNNALANLLIRRGIAGPRPPAATNALHLLSAPTVGALLGRSQPALPPPP